MLLRLFYILCLFLLVGMIACTNSASNEPKEETIDYAAITKLLDSIYIEDQRVRNAMQPLAGEYGVDSDTFKLALQEMLRVDSLNLIAVSTILDQYGWLGVDEIGGNANSALFLVIQHATQEAQEKYLPMMREAVKAGKAKGSSLAMLEDRVALSKGEPQIYGSQIVTLHITGETFVEPMIDPDNVNQRRAEVGLGPIEEYVERFGLTWDLEAYKAELPMRLQQLKERRGQ